jgi:DNA-directed RNA polymerase specialized sigma24 family protein
VREVRKDPADAELGHAPMPGTNVISSECDGTAEDNCFLTGLESWNRLAAQTAKRLERQIGRPHTEFNRDCLRQELLWQVCRAMRRCNVRNDAALATRVVRNRARDILRRARACGRTQNQGLLAPRTSALLIDHRHDTRCCLAEFYERLETVLGLLTETQQRAVETATVGEACAASEMGISRRQLRKVRSEVRVAFERGGLHEFLSVPIGHGHLSSVNQREEVS